MHERTACVDIVRKALEVAPAETRVTELRVSLGADAHSSAAAVVAWIKAAAAQTPAAGAAVVIVPCEPGGLGMHLVGLDIEDR